MGYNKRGECSWDPNDKSKPALGDQKTDSDGVRWSLIQGIYYNTFYMNMNSDSIAHRLNRSSLYTVLFIFRSSQFPHHRKLPHH